MIIYRENLDNTTLCSNNVQIITKPRWNMWQFQLIFNEKTRSPACLLFLSVEKKQYQSACSYPSMHKCMHTVQLHNLLLYYQIEFSITLGS